MQIQRVSLSSISPVSVNSPYKTMRIIPKVRFGDSTPAPQKNIFRRAFDWVINGIKRFWNWLHGKKPASASPVAPPVQPDPIVTEAGLPKHHRQTTTSGGSVNEYIVDNCTTNSMKTAMSFVFSENDPQVVGIISNLNDFLRGIEQSGLTTHQLRFLENNMKSGANFHLDSYDRCPDWNTFIQHLQQKNIGDLYIKQDGFWSITPYGMMAFLSKCNFKTRLFWFGKPSSKDNKNLTHNAYVNRYINRYLEVLQALKQEKPVIVGDGHWKHAYLIVRRNNQLYWSNPMSSQWQKVTHNSLPNGFQIFDQDYDAFQQASVVKKEQLVNQFPKGFMMIIDELPPKNS